MALFELPSCTCTELLRITEITAETEYWTMVHGLL